MSEQIIQPSKRVPKKYWKYADKFHGRQLYKVERVSYGLIFRCGECGQDIPALQEFTRLYFREPNTLWSRKVGLPLCDHCISKL